MKQSPFFTFLMVSTVLLFSFSTNIKTVVSQHIHQPDSLPLFLNMCSNKMICEGDTVQIFGEAGGGTGNYSYNWSPTTFLSDPNISNPLANPDSSTIYTLTVFDGINSVSDSMSIVVFHCPHPEIIALPNDTVPLDDSILLNAGGGYLAYIWEDGSMDSTYIATNNSGPAGGEQVYSITIYTAGGCSGSDTISVWFLPELSVNEPGAKPQIMITSDLQNDQIIFSSEDQHGNMRVDFMNLNGQLVFSKSIYYTSGQRLRIDISSLSRGIHVLRVYNNLGDVIATEKIVK